MYGYDTVQGAIGGQAMFRALFVTLVLALAGCSAAPVAPSPEARTALAAGGKLRVGLYLGNPLSAVRDSATQELKGVSVDLGRELARRLGAAFEPVVYPSIGALVTAAGKGEWDVSMFQVSPARSQQFDFTGPLAQVELGYLVGPSSTVKNAEDLDRPGIRIAVQENSQADALLAFVLKQATRVPAPGVAAGLALVRAGKADALATTKPSLFEAARDFPGARVLEGRFAAENIAMAVPKGRAAAAVTYARQFVEDVKADGTAAAAIQKAGVRGAVVAR